MTGLLFEKIASEEILISLIEAMKLGCEKARDNAGASGDDGGTCSTYGVGSDMRLAELCRDLHGGG